MRYGFKNAEEVKEASLKYNLHSWSVQGKLNPAVVEKAEGIYYYTADGKKMADMSSQPQTYTLPPQHRALLPFSMPMEGTASRPDEDVNQFSPRSYTFRPFFRRMVSHYKSFPCKEEKSATKTQRPHF